MHKLVGSLVQQMGNAYPELGQAKSLIEETLLRKKHVSGKRWIGALSYLMKSLQEFLRGGTFWKNGI